MRATIQKLSKDGLEMIFYNSRVPAGFPSPAGDYMEEEIDLAKILQPNPSSSFVIRIKGESMRDACIPDNCYAVVDRSIKPKSGSIVLAVLNGEFTVKRLVITNRHVVLHPDNPSFSPLVITDEMDFEVWGVVTFTITDHRKK